MTIKMYENKAEKNFYFKIFWNKKAILIGQKFPSRTECLSHIERTLSALKTNNMINVRSEGKGYAFTITKTDSVVFKSLDLASDGLAYLKEFVGNTDEFKIIFDTKKEQTLAKKLMVHEAARYDFKQASATKKPGFELIDNATTNFFYFHFNDAKGKPFLYSRAYDGKKRRTKAAKRLINAVKSKEIVKDRRAVKEGLMLVIKDKDGLEIARSRTYKKRTSLDKAFTHFKKVAEGKDQLIKVPKKKKGKKKSNNKKKIKLPKEKYALKQIAPIAEVGFEGFKSAENKLHYFHYHDKKGTTLLHSPAFTARKAREEAIQEVIQFSKEKRNYGMKEKGKKHYFTLLDKEKKELARSRFFASRKEMIEGMRHFHSNAKTYGESGTVVMVPTTEIIPMLINEPKPIKKLKKKGVVAPTNKSDVATPSLNGAKNTKPKVVTKEPVLPAKTIKSNGTPTKKVVPASKSTTTAPIKEKTLAAQKTKRPLAAKPNTARATPKAKSVPRKTPVLKEVDKTARASTKTKVHPIPLKKREPRKITTTKKEASTKPAPPRIQPRSDSADQSVINWWWVPVLLVAALILYGLFRLLSGFLGQEQSVLPVNPAKKEITQTVEKLPTLLGPSSMALGFEKGSLSAKVADFLSLPESVFPKTFLLDKVHFSFNENTLTADAQSQLNRIAQILGAYPKSAIQINGHTDNTGNPDRNLTLSARRASIVKDYLSSKGITADRIATKGFGITQPIKSNETEEGKKANRRSEIVLLKRE